MKTSDDPRRVAVQVLLYLEKNRHTPVQAVLHTRLSRLTQASSRALCTELVYGVLRMECRLEAVLRRVLPRPEQLPRPCMLVLLLGSYSLLFLEHDAPYAVLDWSVRYIRRQFGQGLARVVNGALRTLQRMGDGPRKEAFYVRDAPDPIACTALFCGVPLWIARLWEQGYGPETARLLLQRSARRPAACLRCNARHAEGETLRQALLAAGGEAVGAYAVRFPAGKLPDDVLGRPLVSWMAAGVCSRQAAGSLAVLEALMTDAAAPLWDACAGQGGKTLALLERGKALRLASDPHAGRLKMLCREAGRLGLEMPGVLCADMTRPPVCHWKGDILLDVPCSGLGTLARRPDIRRRPAQALLPLLQLQSRLLDAARACVPSGAALWYMTCTLHPAENEGQIRAYLQRHPSDRLEQVWQTPHEDPLLEGMFGARLRVR